MQIKKKQILNGKHKTQQLNKTNNQNTKQNKNNTQIMQQQKTKYKQT